MVQKQAANMRTQGDDFADDDPLAELARIVGFDQPLKRDPVVSLPQAPDMGSADFNLEDELMREFEGYESAPAPSSYAPPLSAPESVVHRPVVVDGYQVPQYREEPSFAPQPSHYAVPEVAYDPEPDAFVVPEVAHSESYAPSFEQRYAEPDNSFSRQAAEVERVVEPEASFDLADELEFAVADADFRPEPVVALSRPVQAEPPRLRLPLANFSAQPVRRAEPEMAPKPPLSDSSLDFGGFDASDVATVAAPAAASLDFGRPIFDWASGPVEPIPAVAPAPSVEVPSLDVQPVAAVSAAEVAGFSVDAAPRSAAVEPAQSVSRVEHDVPDFSFDFLNELALDDEPPVAVKAPEPIVEVVARPAAADDEFDPFVDDDFDLQLDDIELDLSELDVAPQKPQPAPATAVAAAAHPVFAAAAGIAAAAPVRAEPAFVPPAPTVATTSFAAPETRPVNKVYSSAPVSAPAPVQPSMPMDDSFAFDPSEISEQDDMLETLSGMDVPDVPVAEAVSAPQAQPDYDYDIDAELASLFEEPVTPPAPKSVATAQFGTAVAAAIPAAVPSAQAPKPQLDDFDAFEKALEEDFRSSMTSTGALEPESRGHITISGEGQGFRFRHLKPYLMAGTAVIVLLAGAGGLYAWLGSGAVGTLSGGEPRVIAADKSPVKIVPENPGGKSVPNQDKAVYDRVSGTGVEDPKQPSLISSEEQPVDVVQRTLIPETLPMEGENEAMATPVGETEDPRLLPDGQPQQAAAEDPATITPRKVRTMVVRPDGTLVAQEVPAEPVSAPAETAVATVPQTAADAPVLAPPSVPSANSTDTVRTVDTRVVTPGGATETQAAASAAAPVAPAAQTVAEAVATPAPADPSAARAPIPTTRPVDQPVNVVGTVTDQGNLRPAQPAATAPAQTEVAAASPATAAPAAAAPAGSYGIQIASLPSEADAQKSYRSLSSKFGNVLGGKPWEIRQADIPGKGTFYRVRVVAGSKDQAVALCEQYRAAGGSCLVSR